MGPVRRIVIECGAAQTRGALFHGDEPLRFWFGPARGDEGLPRGARRRDIFLGRVRAATQALHGAFVDIGEAREAFLPVKPGAALPVEGAAIIVAVRRPALAAKGAMLVADWRGRLSATEAARIEALAGAAPAPTRLNADIDAALAAFDWLAPRTEMRVALDDADAANALRGAFARRSAKCSVEHGVARDDLERIDEAVETALSREVALSGGARLIIDETEAMGVVDVDAGAAASDARGRLSARVNAAAAARLFVELSRRGIGGRIVVDFLPPGDAKARAMLVDALKAARGDLYECRFGRLSADGLFDMTAPREAESLLESATEPVFGEARCGRRFTLDWSAKAAMRALERRLTVSPASRPRLIVGGGLADYVEHSRPQWRARLAARYGARFAVERDLDMQERAYDVVER